MAKPIPILFTHFGEQWLRGSEVMLLDLLKQLDSKKFEPIVWCNGHELAEAVKDAGFAVYRGNFELFFDYGCPKFSLTRWRSQVEAGKQLVRHHGVRILHANGAAPMQWLVPVARSLRLPLLGHLHIDYLRRSRYVLGQHQANLLIGVSGQVLEDYRKDGLPEAKLRVIYNGINLSRLQHPLGRPIRNEYGIPSDAIVVTILGSLIRRKGHDLLLQAMAQTRHLGLHALFVGDGPERSTLEAHAAHLGLERHIHFTGFLKEVPDVLLASDIVCLPSRADAFGLVLAEAAYMQRPTIGTSIGGIPEVIAHEETGLVVPPEDPTSLAKALVRLANSADLRERMGQAGRERVLRMFGVERMAEDFQQAYLQLTEIPASQLGWRNSALKPYVKLVTDLITGRKEAPRR